MNSNRPDQTRPITFQWALALTFVAWFVEVILTMLLRPALLRSGMQPMAAASLIRVACYGLVFSTLLHAGPERTRAAIEGRREQPRSAMAARRCLRSSNSSDKRSVSEI